MSSPPDRPPGLHDPRLSRLLAVRRLIEATTESWPDLATLSSRAAMSPFHFLRLFRATFSNTPHQCVVDARIERAKQLLADTDWDVTEICAAVGYESLGTFSSLFRNRTGLSPRAYRKRRRRFWSIGAEFPRRIVPGCFLAMFGRSQNRNIQEESRCTFR